MLDTSWMDLGAGRVEVAAARTAVVLPSLELPGADAVARRGEVARRAGAAAMLGPHLLAAAPPA